MSKSFEVIKLYKITITEPTINSLDDYYKLKSIYDEVIHNHKTKRKCIHCNKVPMTSLTFEIKDRHLISTCPTSGCLSNMNIPIDTCIMYDEYYNETKEKYEQVVDTILSTKFKILFGYIHEKESDIVQLKDNYKSKHEEYMESIQHYKDITYVDDAKIEQLEQRRNEIIDQLKTREDTELYKDLQVVLCELRKLNYKIELPTISNRIINMSYTLEDLQMCDVKHSSTVDKEPPKPPAEDKEPPKPPDEDKVQQKNQKTQSENPQYVNKKDYIQFYSKSADKEIQLLSNLADIEVEYNSRKYRTIEHAYQLLKYKYSEPKEKAMKAFEKLYEESKELSGKEAVTLGKRKQMEKLGIKLNIHEWNKVSLDIMKQLVKYKIDHSEQVQTILKKIKASGKQLLHFSNRDMEWGGMITTDKETGKEILKGNNTLGNIYMEFVDKI
jgi:ribA/ribD-fused uncharacterized protein